MVEHKHAIILIKNCKGEYLQYFDDRWNSFLFLNCKLTDEEYLQTIRDNLIKKFGLTLDNVNIRYVMDKLHQKYSESARKIKQYHHFFYIIENTKILKELQDNEFKLNNIHFAWFSLTQMQNNKRIQEVNKDIVDFVKEINL